MHLWDFELQSREARVRVAHLLEWWTCARIQFPSAKSNFFLNWVLIDDFIFEMTDFNIFCFNFIKKKLRIFSSKHIEIDLKYSRFPSLWNFFSVSSSLNSDSLRRHQRHAAKAPLQYDCIISLRIALPASKACRYFNDGMRTTFSDWGYEITVLLTKWPCFHYST